MFMSERYIISTKPEASATDNNNDLDNRLQGHKASFADVTEAAEEDLATPEYLEQGATSKGSHMHTQRRPTVDRIASALVAGGPTPRFGESATAMLYQYRVCVAGSSIACPARRAFRRTPDSFGRGVDALCAQGCTGRLGHHALIIWHWVGI